jgi:hypothetical protein
MHFKNIILSNCKIAIIFIISYIMCSCNNNFDHKNKISVNNNFDSIIYNLPDKTLSIIDSYSEKKPFCFISIVSNSETNIYSFTIYYQNCNDIKSDKIKYLIKTSKRFLRTKKHLFPIILYECSYPQKSYSLKLGKMFNFKLSYEKVKIHRKPDYRGSKRV